MAPGVVDVLEVIEIDEEHAHRLAHSRDRTSSCSTLSSKQPAVGQAGERIVPGHVRDLLDELQVLECGGRLVGQTRQALVEVGVVGMVAAWVPDPKLAATTPRNSALAKSGATTEAVPGLLQQTPKRRVRRSSRRGR
jgi:hypothetical protein